MEFRIEQIRDRIQPVAEEVREGAAETVAALSRPRLAGTEGATEVAAELRTRFETLGYEIQDLPFSFSTLPGRWGMPLCALAFLLGVVAAVAALLSGAPGLALVALLMTAAILALAAGGAGAAIRKLPAARLDSANWLIRRPGARPRYLIMAHRDSKSQPVSLFVRAAAAVAAVLGWSLLLVLALVGMVAPSVWVSAVAVAGVPAILGGVLVGLAWAGNGSSGALDNASGVAALLELARLERDRGDVGFLVTDGEELGLAGASAVCRQLPPVFGVINLDGLDDRGELRIIERHGVPRRGLAPHLSAALLSAAGALDQPATRGALPIGLLVDHVPLVEAGIPAVTVMRGDAASLRRVHRPEDTADRLRGDGIAATVAVVAGALEVLRGAGTPVPRPGLVPRG